MRTTTIALGSLLLVLAVIYFAFRDHLPPRTPHKVARLVSHLSIPNNAIVIEYQDQWNEFNGDGFSFIILQLNEEFFAGLYREAEDKGYKKLPVGENIYGPFKEISDKTRFPFPDTIDYAPCARCCVREIFHVQLPHHL